MNPTRLHSDAAPRTLVTVCLSAAVGCASAQPAVLVNDRLLWQRVESDHFVIESNHHDVEVLVALALEFETFLRGLGSVPMLGRRMPTQKTLVVAFDDTKHYRWFMKGRSSGFFHRSSPLGPMIVMPVTRRVWRSDVLKHELSHLLLSHYLPEAPDWLDEGIACTVETAHYDSDRGHLVFGEPDAGRLQAGIGVGRLSLIDLIAQWPNDAGPELYSAGWLLVRYLLDNHADEFLNFQARVSRGEPWTKAWSEEMPLALEEMTEPLDTYRRRQRFGRWTVQVHASAGRAPSVGTPSTADVFALLAALYVMRTDHERPTYARYAAAAHHLREAREREPSNARAALVSAYLKDEESVTR